MAYTVKQIAKISGVSSRTLRFYDEVGLLKPAYYGENNYRYYEEEQLLILQQILFFRELEFSLGDIQRILCSNDFDKVDSLLTHKSMLLEDIVRKEVLIKTIDKTVSHLRGNLIMNEIEMYDGFDPKKQREYEQYLIESGTLTEKEIDESWQNVRDWKQDNWANHKALGEEVNQGLVQAIKKGLKPGDEDVQELIQKHYEWVRHFWTPTRESYVGLGQMYLDHPDFKQHYDGYHPNLAEFLVVAMKVYAIGLS